MTELGNCVTVAIVCYTFRSVFFRWAEHLEKRKPQSELSLTRALDLERQK